MRAFIPALIGAILFVTPAMAETKQFTVVGGSGPTAYQGTVSVTPVPGDDAASVFMNIEWTFGAYTIKGFGIVEKDDPSVLTVSYVVPVGLGVGRYKQQSDGSAVGVLVGEKGIFVTETWTPVGGVSAAPATPPPAAASTSPSTGGSKAAIPSGTKTPSQGGSK